MTVRYIITYLLEPVSHFLFLIALLFYLRMGNAKLWHKVICVYYFIGFVILFKIVFTKYNSYLYSFLYLTTSVSFAFYFYLLLGSSKTRWLALLYGIVTLTYYLIKEVFLGADPLFPSIGYVITSTGIILLIFIFLHQLMTNVKEESLSLNFDFWFICSQLIYQLGSFGIFLTYNHLTAKILPEEHFSDENRYLLTYLWGVHNVLLFLGSLLTWFGILWIVSRRRSTLL
jgi:hypothetical protein